MTPAIQQLKKAKCHFSIHEYQHDASVPSYGLEAAQKLAVDAEQVFKTLVVKLDSGALAVAVIPVQQKLSLKAMAKACAAKKAEMADKMDVQRSTGYVLGGVSPLGQKKRLISIIDQSAQQHASIYVSGGKRGLEIQLSSEVLAKMLAAKFANLSVTNS
ncbi:Cys-tRNA(Pro) deacylase [Paraglaciecola aestuariivivens]